MKISKISKLEISIWAGILCIAAVLLLIVIKTSEDGDYVQVRIDGKVTDTYSLKDSGTYPIEGSGENILVIEDGKAYIKEADCPDKLCIKQGKIQKVGQSLICLPNKVVVEVISMEQKDDGVDAVAK